MKKNIIILILTGIFNAGFSQQRVYEYGGRPGPSINKEKLNEAKFVHDLMPGFSRYVVMPSGERKLFDEQLNTIRQPYPYYTYPPEFHDLPNEDYRKALYFVSMEITTISNGKPMISKSGDILLTREQKSILNAADPDSDIIIKVKFRYKNQGNISVFDLEELKEGTYTITVVPPKEAEYPGGFSEMSAYLIKNVFNKISDKAGIQKISKAVVKFSVNETGQVVNAKIATTSTDQKIDKLLLDAINKMPKWKPAEDLKGARLKQEFAIPLGFSGC